MNKKSKSSRKRTAKRLKPVMSLKGSVIIKFKYPASKAQIAEAFSDKTPFTKQIEKE